PLVRLKVRFGSMPNQHAKSVRSPDITSSRKLRRLAPGILSSFPAFLIRLVPHVCRPLSRFSAGYDSCQQTADKLSKDCECGCRVGKTDWPLSSDDERATIGNRSGIARTLLRRRTRRDSPGKSRFRQDA